MKSKDCERREHKRNKYNLYVRLVPFAALRSLCVCDAATASFDTPKGSLMDKYELPLALNDLLRVPKEEEKHLQTFAQSAKCQPQMDA